MTKTKVHEKALSSCVGELFIGNEAIVRILHFLVMNILPHLAYAIKFPGF
jgi:hypothetical protein